MRTVDWAGDPDRVVQVAANKRTLLPRKSFQKFAKTVNNTSVCLAVSDVFPLSKPEPRITIVNTARPSHARYEFRLVQFGIDALA
eukprot:799416-Rhodomonas_salina.2